MTTETSTDTDTILARLNEYGGENIWNDVILTYDDEIDWDRTDGELSAETYSDAFALTNGTVIEVDEDGRWVARYPDIRYDLTIYSDGQDTEHIAVTVPLPEVERVLGEPHQGDPEQDERLIRMLREAGAPEWTDDPEGGWGCCDVFDIPAAWGIYGPALTPFHLPSLPPDLAGRALRDWRDERGLTQTEAAEMINSSIRTWQDWEHGKRGVPAWIGNLCRDIDRQLDA